MEEGFSNSRANAIIQDRKGFIWVGTWNGLNRYDGYECLTFQPEFQDTNTISNKEIIELMEDSEGNIWIATSNGLNCMNPKSGKLKTYKFQNRILSLCEDSKHNIWIGTWSGGLHKLTPSTGEIKHYLDYDYISDIYLDSRQILWVGTYNGLVRFNTENSEFERFIKLPNKNSICNSTITNITESADGNLWVGTWGGGLDRINISENGSQLYFTNFHSMDSETSICDNVITKLCYDQFNNLWIGTWNNGLCRLTEDQQMKTSSEAKFTFYQEKTDNTSGIMGKRISALLVDKTGVLWVGGSKIACTSVIETGIHSYQLPLDKLSPNIKPTKSTLAVYKDQIWISSDYYIFQYELKNNLYKLRKIYNKPNYQISSLQAYSGQILSLASNSEGLWVGTDDAGLLFYPFTKDLLLDIKNSTQFYQQSQTPIPGNKITSLLISENYNDVIWLGTMQSGFAKLIKTKQKTYLSEIYYAGKENNNCTDNNIRCIFEDKNGLIWIGTQNGLNCFDPFNKTFEKFYSSSDSTSLNDNIINTITEDSFGNIWIGTNSGLNRIMKIFNQKGIREIIIKGYPEIKYIKNEIVTNIIEDQSHNLWIRTYKGFLKFNILKESVLGEYFSKDFENTHLDRNSTLLTQKNEIILAHLTNFLTFNPDSVNKKSIPPNVTITDFKIFNESISNLRLINKYTDNQLLIPYAQKINISYKEKMLTFVFSAMDYKNPKKNEYSYKLEGFDKQWNNIGFRNYATYTNLPDGKYTFKIKAKNSDGFWSQKETLLNIIIPPPFWKTTWAYIIYVLISIGIIYFFNQFTIIKEKEKNKLKFEKLKTEEITRLNEMKSNFFTDMTHELKTPLTLILGPAHELFVDKSLNAHARKEADLIKRSAHKLLRLVNQLMEFKKIETGIAEELHFQQQDINLILQEIYNFFKSTADSREIRFEIHLLQKNLVAFVDPDKIEKVIFNLVSNAFKYSKDNGVISIFCDFQANEKGEKIVIIKVKDQGIGIAEEHKNKIFDRFYQVNQIRTQSTGGIGLFLAKALVEQHSGSLTVESKLGEGSCFQITLPFNPDINKDQNFIKTTTDNSKQDDYINEISEIPELTKNRPSDSEDIDKPLILIVEDDADLNEFIVRGLSSEYKTISAYNGKEALHMAHEQIPDLILTDIMMPEMDGLDFCQSIRKNQNTSHIPIIILTAKTMEEDEMTGLKFGAVDYIFKPFNLVSVKLKINNILSNLNKLNDKLRTERILEPEKIELHSLDELFLKNAVDSINQNLDNPKFDVDAFSETLKMSSNQVYRKIKALTGQTAKEFIRNQRLKIAATLLIQRKRTISEIIYMVGFTSPSYFTRCFKNYFGCTPKEYMERNS